MAVSVSSPAHTELTWAVAARPGRVTPRLTKLVSSRGAELIAAAQFRRKASVSLASKESAAKTTSPSSRARSSSAMTMPTQLPAPRTA